MPPVRPYVWQDEPRRQLQRFFDRYYADKPLHRVLDAGAGQMLYLDIPLDAQLVGIDIAADGLSRNRNIDQAIIGDVQTYEHPAERYDAVICWWLLEHLPQPRAALENLIKALRSDGLLVVCVPYLWGFKALVARATPFSFHVLLAKRHNPQAGQPGFGPYPTFLRWELTPRRLAATAGEFGLERIYQHTWTTSSDQALPSPLRRIYRATGATVRTLTASSYDPLLTDHIAVFRKR